MRTSAMILAYLLALLVVTFEEVVPPKFDGVVVEGVVVEGAVVVVVHVKT